MGGLDSGHLFSGLLIGTFGFAALIFGKKSERPVWMVTGLTMCVFPYFVGSLVLMWLIAAGCVGGAVVVEKGG